MANFIYPNDADLKLFTSLIQESNYQIKKYLPHIDDEWFRLIGDCVHYVHSTSLYENHPDIHSACAQLLYKIVKRHELGDGNKRSAVICSFIFCFLNDYAITDPAELKSQAKRLASTRGRSNEKLMRDRVAQELKRILLYMDPKIKP